MRSIASDRLSALTRRHPAFRRYRLSGLLAIVLVVAGLNGLRADDSYDGTSDRVQQAGGRDAAGGSERVRQVDAERAERELDKRVRVLRKGSSSRAARRAALERLPLDELGEDEKRQALGLLRSAAMFRELPTLQCEVEPAVYRYFEHHPDVAVSIWRAMKISVFQMTQTGPKTYDVDSGDGTTGKVLVLYESDEDSLVICSGSFKTPLVPKPIEATGLLHLQTRMKRRKDGVSIATHRGWMFVAFPSQTVGTVAKIISPVSNLIIDRNFREVSLFLHMMSLAMQRQPGWIERVAKQLDGVPAARREELLKLTARVYVDARRRQLLAAGRPIDEIELLLPPVAGANDRGTERNRPRVVSKPAPMAN